MLLRKENHRPYEEIIQDLQKELRPVKEESLLTHAIRLFTELEHKTTSPLFTHLQSPMTTNPGEIGVHMAEVLTDVDIDADCLKHIMDFFSYDKESLKGNTIYYAEKHYSESHPIYQLDGKYVCSINKFFIEGLYYRIDETLQKDDAIGKKYKQNKDDAILLICVNG